MSQHPGNDIDTKEPLPLEPEVALDDHANSTARLQAHSPDTEPAETDSGIQDWSSSNSDQGGRAPCEDNRDTMKDAHADGTEHRPTVSPRTVTSNGGISCEIRESPDPISEGQEAQHMPGMYQRTCAQLPPPPPSQFVGRCRLSSFYLVYLKTHTLLTTTSTITEPQPAVIRLHCTRCRSGSVTEHFCSPPRPALYQDQWLRSPSVSPLLPPLRHHHHDAHHVRQVEQHQHQHQRQGFPEGGWGGGVPHMMLSSPAPPSSWSEYPYFRRDVSEEEQHRMHHPPASLARQLYDATDVEGFVYSVPVVAEPGLVAHSSPRHYHHSMQSHTHPGQQEQYTTTDGVNLYYDTPEGTREVFFCWHDPVMVGMGYPQMATRLVARESVASPQLLGDDVNTQHAAPAELGDSVWR